MVFEYMDHDLTGLSDRPGMRFSVPQIKCYMRQLLTGLHYCHVNQVLHRDIKGVFQIPSFQIYFYFEFAIVESLLQ
jgi:serine/threonine protein kinase